MRANPAIRASLLALTVVLSGCSGKLVGGGIQVLVVFDSSVQSRCLKVVATEDGASHETNPVALSGQTSPLHVAVVQRSSEDSFVDLQAVGFLDDLCTQPTPGETSEVVRAQVTQPVRTVTLTLRAASTDGGMDGGTDGGMDGGVDLDHDSYSPPEDCNDSNPNIHPGATEACANGVDDNCDRLTDCQELTCTGQQCAGGGTCSSSGTCLGATELSCSDGVDNDGDTLIDCADPDCPVGSGCDDLNLCTVGDHCSATATCEKTADFECTNSGLICYQSVGVCLTGPDAGCAYSPSPPESLCNDGLNCTVNDRCDGNGGCAGTQVTCTPADQCQQWLNSCDADGRCMFGPRVNQACDAGIGPGSCTPAGRCQSQPSGPFPYTPSNFDVGQMPSTNGKHLVVDCDAIIDTDNLSTGCLGSLSMVVMTLQGGQQAVLLAVDSVDVHPSFLLSVIGRRPLIIAVLGNVTINGLIRATNAAGNSSECGNGGAGNHSGQGFSGGGGGGFGNPGGPGGISGGGTAGAGGPSNGNPSLIPIRGGCNGGNGTDNGSGGRGGGAIQISAGGDATIAGIITVAGAGGIGGVSDNASGGGGGSGGAILLEGRTISLKASGRITANGGGGGEGHISAFAEPGRPGSEDSDVPAAGGDGTSTTGGNGGNGAAGNISSTQGDLGQFFTTKDDWAGGGGGGGGVGRIRFNAALSCDLTGNNSVVSPAATSNGAPGCLK